MTIRAKLLSADIDEKSDFRIGHSTRAPTLYLRYASSWKDMAKTAMNDEIELVLWKRAQPLVTIRATKAESEFEILLGEQQDILVGFDELLNASAWPEDLQEIVEQDVKNCLNAFEAILPSSHYRLRLQAISDDACRKLHQDTTFQRLIITYRGDGTVWHDVKHNTDQQAIEMECVLLRGKRAEQPAQILHRSPVFSTGELPRLIMAIDVIPDLYEK